MTITLDDTAPPQAITPAATAEQAALLAWAADHRRQNPRPAMSAGDKRYILPDDTGTDTEWTRVTTFVEAIEDGAALTDWKVRLATRGIVTNPDLYTQARAEHDNDKAMTALGTEAAWRAGSKLAADIGTALHLATEHHDLGTGHRPPDPWGGHVDAWAGALAAHGIEILPDWIERTVIHPEFGCAGTLDRLVRLPDGRTVVLDVKTGKSVRKITYAAQAAIYARAAHAWTPDGYQPLPDIDTTVAIVAHLSATEGTCELMAIDLGRGWEVAQLCHAIRTGRSVKGVFTRWETPAAAEVVAEADPTEERTTEIRERIAAIKVTHPGQLGTVWPDGIPTKGPWTLDDMARIGDALHAIDGKGSWWPPADPEAVAKRDAKMATGAAKAWPEPTPRLPAPTDDTSPLVDDSTRAALVAALKALPPAQHGRVDTWRAAGRRDGQPWGHVGAGKMTERTFARVLAAIRCADCLWDDAEPDALTRAALSLAIGDDLHPAWSTGAVLGSLTIDQATRLDDIAAAFGAGDETTTKALGHAVVRVV